MLSTRNGGSKFVVGEYQPRALRAESLPLTKHRFLLSPFVRSNPLTTDPNSPLLLRRLEIHYRRKPNAGQLRPATVVRVSLPTPRATNRLRPQALRNNLLSEEHLVNGDLMAPTCGKPLALARQLNRCRTRATLLRVRWCRNVVVFLKARQSY